MKFHQLFEAYQDLQKGTAYPHRLVVNPRWNGLYQEYWPFQDPWEKFNDAVVVIDENEPNFRFEDVR
jgi:hypothetical protein